MAPLLYSFRRCPYAARARMALQVAEIRYDLCEVELRNKPDALLRASPKGTVPVLVLEDGRVLEQSLDIMLWALAQNDPQAWLLPEQSATLALIAHNDGVFKQQLDRYKYKALLAERDDASRFLATLNDRIDGALFATRFTLADIALLPFVRQFAQVDRTWFCAQPWPRLLAWLQSFESSELYLRAMRK